MSYSADTLKKAYETECREQRKKNLVELREKVAKLSATDFSKKIGIQKSNLSTLEKGDRDLSLFNIQAYKTYFLQEHNLNISVDYLLGYTKNKYADENYQMISAITGLSDNSIDCLKYIQLEQAKIPTMQTLNTLMNNKELFNTLLANIDIILNSSSWVPATTYVLTDNTDYVQYRKLSDNTFNAFIKENKNGNNIGAMIIDSSIMESHAYQVINNILTRYKKDVVKNETT